MRRAPRHAAGISSLAVNKADPKVLQDFLALKYGLSRRSAKAIIDGRSVWVNRACVWIARYALKTGDVVEVPTQVVKGAVRQSESRGRDGSSRQNEERRRDGSSRQNEERRRGVSPRQNEDEKLSPLTRRAAASPGAAVSPRHIRVLWQDEHFLVCDKPAGVLASDDPRSVEAILRAQEKIPTLEAVHRLDRDTTGCLLFSKNHAAWVAAVEVFKTRRVEKTYHAISVGAFRFPRMKIDTPLDGQEAVSLVTREAASPDAAFLRVRIETGRTNQIRRHLASVRAPIVGDRVFGLKNARDPRLMRVARQMLHASTLALPHPLVSHAEIKVHSPLPADFRSTLRLFGMGK